MFDFECVANAVRAMDLDSVPNDLSRCRQLELKAKHLGYQNWNHLLDTLKNEPAKDRLQKSTMRLNAADLPNALAAPQQSLRSTDCPAWWRSWPLQLLDRLGQERQ